MKEEEGEEAQEDEAPAHVEIDFEGMDRRIVGAPGLPAKDYGGLVPGPSGSVFVTRVGGEEGDATLLKYTVADRAGGGFPHAGSRRRSARDAGNRDRRLA